MLESRPVVAFFDADETLTAMKGLFELLRHHVAQEGPDGAVRQASYDQLVEPLRKFAASGGSAVDVNVKYFEILARTPLERLTSDGREWFAKLRAEGVPYIEATLQALRDHQAKGHLTVVVSGSWLPCLQPIVDDLGIDRVLCTEPEVDADGRLTGGVVHAMFGPAKAEAARAVIAECGARPEDCYAYADDIGDLGLLSTVGHPVVVGENAALLAAVDGKGWARLPGTPVAGTVRRQA
ncbi:HAD-IB family hydrolase [Streptomyces morookaense]|uniref:HAD family hydrolase n=1 Tax=Streptomyces morookaense TaxID=1970 RepID=UPI0033CFC814